MPSWLITSVIVAILVLAVIFVFIPLLLIFICAIVRIFDRTKEGKRLKTITPMNRAMPYIMKDRCDALNYISDTIDISAAEKYIAKMRAKGYKSFGLMHLFIAAYVRVISEKPGVNRYIRGREVHKRNGIQVMLTIKKEMSLDSPDTVVKIFPKASDTALDVYNQLDELVSSNKMTKDTNNSFDKTAKVLSYLPGFLFRYIAWLLFVIDYVNLLPTFLTTKVSPFHGSLFVTSMGSLGIPPIYHHIYNFGNVPAFLSFGTKRKQLYTDIDGNVKVRKVIDIKVVTDERVCDGFYFASALKTMKHYIKHPEKLDIPPETITEDIN